MNMLKKSLFSLLFVTAGLHAAAGSLQQNLQVAAEQKTVALQMIEAMQGSVNFYQQAQKPLDAAGIKEQQSAWQSAVGLYHRYINDLRGQSKVARPALVNLQNLPNIDALMLQSNQSKALFTRLLDEYIAHLGNVYEKKSNLLRFYRNVYVIASADDQNLSITPNEYLALVQTLENAAQQGDWGTTVNLSLPVIQTDGSIVEKNLTLNEIKAAIKEIPLPASYYATALKVAAGVAVGAALIGGAYYAYNPQAFNFLQGKVAQAEQNLDTAADQAQPVEQNAVANLDAAQPSAPAAVEASDAQPAQTSMWDYLMGRGSGYNADAETIDSDSFKDSDSYKEEESTQQAGYDKEVDDAFRRQQNPKSAALVARGHINEKDRQAILKYRINKIENEREKLRNETIRKQANFNDVMPPVQDAADNSSKQTILSNIFGSSQNQDEISPSTRELNQQSVDNLQAITEDQPAVQADFDSSIMNYNNGSLDLTEAIVDNSPVITETPVKAAVKTTQVTPSTTTLSRSAQNNKDRADARNKKRFGN